MVAKGHDFPEVTLAAILDADATLRFPDFRAEERTFAMVAQLAGRSGRGEAGGDVIVQTLAPTASSIEHAARHDSAGFLAGELRRRELLRYPPFSHLVRIGLNAEQEARVEAAAAALATELRERCRGTPSCSARRRCSASATAIAAASWSSPRTARAPSPRSATWSSAAPPTARSRTSRSASTSIPSERRATAGAYPIRIDP